MAESDSLATEKLRFSTKLAYGAGDFGPAIAANILVFYLLFFLTDVVGLPAGLAGSVLMIGKIFDAVNDPIIGLLSDRTRSLWGRRIPWILAGALPFALFNGLQWIVPHFSDDPQTNQWRLFAYYTAIALGFNGIYTVVNLPYTALTPELTQSYTERTRLNSFRFAFSIGGSILSLVLYILLTLALPNQPQAQFAQLGFMISILALVALLWSALRLQERGKAAILSVLQRRRLGWVVALGGIGLGGVSLWRWVNVGFNYQVFFLGLLAAMAIAGGWTLRDGQIEDHLSRIVPESEAPTLPLKTQFKIAFTNGPFLYVIGIYLCSWLAVQLTASILVYFVVSWMGLSEQQSGTLALTVQGTALIFLFLWQAIAAYLDKKVIYALGTLIWMGAQGGLWLVQPGQTTLMYGLGILAGIGVSVAYLIPWSMIPDVVDLDELQTGQRREGVFYAFMVLLQKIGLALGLFLVGLTLEWAGFIPRIPGEPIPTQPASALWAIRFAVAPLPALFLLGGLMLALRYPLTRSVHHHIRQQLQERSQQS